MPVGMNSSVASMVLLLPRMISLSTRRTFLDSYGACAHGVRLWSSIWQITEHIGSTLKFKAQHNGRFGLYLAGSTFSSENA